MGGWWTWLNGLLYGVGGLACASVAMLVAFQEKLVYVPVIPGMKRGYPIVPSRLHLRYEDVWLTAKDGVRLHSWYIEAQASCPGNISDSFKRRSIASQLKQSSGVIFVVC